MNERSNKPGFASRPGSAERWVKTAEAPARRANGSSVFTARLAIDVTPAMRGRIKVAAFRRGITVADMLRDLLAREFPDGTGEPS